MLRNQNKCQADKVDDKMRKVVLSVVTRQKEQEYGNDCEEGSSRGVLNPMVQLLPMCQPDHEKSKVFRVSMQYGHIVLPSIRALISRRQPRSRFCPMQNEKCDEIVNIVGHCPNPRNSKAHHRNGQKS